MAAEVHVDEKVLAKFAQKLAGNEKKFRDRAVKKLRKWMLSRSSKGGFNDLEMLKVWKGLHYCMWMADKPLIQEDLAETLARLLSCFPTTEESLEFFNCFLQTEAREWFGIDRLRLDKFLMLIRRMFRHMLMHLNLKNWDEKHIESFTSILSSSVLSASNMDVPDGLKFHFVDIYLEELENFSDKLNADTMELLLDPYAVMISKVKNNALFGHILKNIFNRLVEQETRGTVEREEMAELREEEEEREEELTKALEVDYAALSERLFELSSSGECVGKNRKGIYQLVTSFKNLSEGILPEDDWISSGSEESLDEADFKEATQRLQTFENRLVSKNKKKRKKALKEAKPRAKKRKMEVERDSYLSQDLKKRQEALRASRASKVKVKAPQSEEKPKKNKKKKKNKMTKLNDASQNQDLKPSQINLNGTEDSDLPNTDAKKLMKKKKVMSQVNSTIGKNKIVTKKKGKKKKKLALQNGLEETSLGKNACPVSELSIKDPSEFSGNKQDSIEVVDVSLSAGESRTFQDSLSETPKSELSPKSKISPKSELSTSNNSPVNKNSKNVESNKKSKKRKRKRSSTGGEGLTENLNSSQVALSSADTENGNNSSFQLNTSGVSKQKKKNENQETPKSEKKQKISQESSETLQEGEVEIWVPNKKYQGQHKKAFQKKMEESLTAGSPLGNGTDSIPRKKFATFDKLKKSPPAFVRKAIEKITPHSEPRNIKRKGPPNAPGSAPNTDKPRKRVSFIMERNMAQDFKSFRKSLNMSPALPFDPNIKPDQGILKSPATPELMSNHMSLKLKKNSAKKKANHLKKNKRAEAADFF